MRIWFVNSFFFVDGVVMFSLYIWPIFHVRGRLPKKERARFNRRLIKSQCLARGWALFTLQTVVSLLLLLDVNCCCESKVYILKPQEGCAVFLAPVSQKTNSGRRWEWNEVKQKSVCPKKKITFAWLISLDGEFYISKNYRSLFVCGW